MGISHLVKLCKTYALSNLAEPKTIYRIHEDLGASTETTGIGLVVFTLQTYTCPSTLLGPTLSDLTMISGKVFGMALLPVYGSKYSIFNPVLKLNLLPE
jgi:hypothetical protein